MHLIATSVPVRAYRCIHWFGGLPFPRVNGVRLLPQAMAAIGVSTNWGLQQLSYRPAGEQQWLSYHTAIWAPVSVISLGWTAAASWDGPPPAPAAPGAHTTRRWRRAIPRRVGCAPISRVGTGCRRRRRQRRWLRHERGSAQTQGATSGRRATAEPAHRAPADADGPAT